MQKLLEQLCLQTDNCSSPITNIWFIIQETSKITGLKRQTVNEHLNKLIEAKVIEKISDEPLQFQFTDIGKKVKSIIAVKKYFA